MAGLGLSRCSIEQNGQQQRHYREDADVASDADIAQLHVTNDDSAQPDKCQRAAGNQQHANRRGKTIPAEDRRSEQDRQREEPVPRLLQQ